MFLILGTSLTEEKTIGSVRVFDTDGEQFFTASWPQFCGAVKAGLVFGNLNVEALSPNEGWNAYAMYDNMGQLISSETWVVAPKAMKGDSFIMVNGDGKVERFTLPLMLVSFAEKNRVANWYGYSTLFGRPFAYNEPAQAGDITLGAPDNQQVLTYNREKHAEKQKQKRTINKLPKSREEQEEEELKTSKKLFRSTAMGDFDKISAWTSNTDNAYTNASADEIFKATKLTEDESNLPLSEVKKLRAQFIEGVTEFKSPKSNTKFLLIGRKSGDDTLLGLAIEHSKENDGNTTRWTVVPEEYKHVSVAYNGTEPVAWLMTPSGEIHMMSLKTSTLITELSGKKLKDFFNVVPASKKAKFVVALGAADDRKYYWSVLGDNMKVEKEITCKMEMASPLFMAGRVYEGPLQTVEFSDLDGMEVILSLKDYSYDSRMKFNTEKFKAMREGTAPETVDVLPTTANVTVDFTSGQISLADDLGNDTVVNTFNTVRDETVRKMFGAWLGVEGTVPVEKEIKVRRHTEKHTFSYYYNVPYEKAAEVCEWLASFEMCTDLHALFNMLVTGREVPSEAFDFEVIKKEFEDSSFDKVADMKDGNPLLFNGKMVGFNPVAGGEAASGILLTFFKRKGTGIRMAQTVLFQGGKPAADANSHPSLAQERLRGMMNMVRNQPTQIKGYDVKVVSSVLLGSKKDVKTVIPKSVRETYSKKGVSLHNPTADVFTLNVAFKVGKPDEGVSFNCFFGIFDSLTFTYSRVTEEDLKVEGLEAKDRAAIHNKLFSTDKPALSTTLPAEFTASLI